MMPRTPRPATRFFSLVLLFLIGSLAPHAAAQDNPSRQNGWQIPDDATSKNNRRLESILKRYPAADANKDGELNADEARKFIEQQRAQRRERDNWRRNRIEPTFDNVKYGPADKQHFDLYRAKSDGPAPLVVFFHGGQFISGDERSFSPFDIRGLLSAGISVASIDYREANEAPFPGPFEDAARAVQFIRFYAEQLHIDPARIAGMGDEAGGNLALYLALQDDLFDQEARDQLEAGALEDPRKKLPQGPLRLPGNNQINDRPAEGDNESADGDELDRPDDKREPDKAQREAEEKFASLDDLLLEELIPWDADAIKTASTKLKAGVALHPIATFDPRGWAQHELPMNGHERLMTKYLDVRYLEPLNDPDVINVVEHVSPLALISADDPPLLLISLYEDLPLTENTIWTIMRHHPKQIQLIADAMQAKSNTAIVRYKGMKDAPAVRSTQFLTEQLQESAE